MKFETIIEHCVEITKVILKSASPPDAIMNEYFRKKKYIGSKERKIISEVVFINLRFLGFTNFIVKTFNKTSTTDQPHKEKIKILISLLINILLYPRNLNSLSESIERLYNLTNGTEYLQNYIIDFLKLNFNFDETKNLILELDYTCKNIPNPQEQTQLLSARYSIPEFILSSWFRYTPYLKANPIKIADSLLYPSNFTIRINNKSYLREEIWSKFNKEGYDCYLTKFSPFGLTFTERVKILEHPYYRQGIIEIQDEGSQLICIACNPEKNSKILDACAGAGGKTLFFAFLQEDTGEIVANDINLLKLKELQKRAIRSGFSSIKTNLLQPGKKKKNILKENYFDIVLVDAPCSGIGTSKRNPMHKWWLNPNKLFRLSKKQLELLSFYSRFLKRGGYLFYSTCSLMPEENQIVAEEFLSSNPHFSPSSISNGFRSFSIEIPTLDVVPNQLTLFPHIHGTDGFFIAKFIKAT
ncbi:MAG: RsmB/NOP family class I SAM-dependent RNA methyltransferase [Ignavibacteria bacterium]|nr:RsmB/NOP family class I SAM-dependent RNA methyltransferase [Ignavibacteria bacterium]